MEEIKDSLRCRLITGAHISRPSAVSPRSQDGGGSLAYQASPKFMAPRQRGLTRTAAVGESILYRARRLLGGGAAGTGLVMAAIRGVMSLL